MLVELFLPSICIIIERVYKERGEKALTSPPVAITGTDLLLHQSCACPPKSLGKISEQHRLGKVVQ